MTTRALSTLISLLILVTPTATLKAESSAVGIQLDHTAWMDMQNPSVDSTASETQPILHALFSEDHSDITPDADYLQGYDAGSNYASTSSSQWEWFLSSIPTGFILPLVGPFSLGLIGATVGANVPSAVDTDQSTSYSDGFASGFEDHVQDRRMRNCILGGFVGTIILVTVLVAAGGPSTESKPAANLF